MAHSVRVSVSVSLTRLEEPLAAVSAALRVAVAKIAATDKQASRSLFSTLVGRLLVCTSSPFA